MLMGMDSRTGTLKPKPWSPEFRTRLALQIWCANQREIGSYSSWLTSYGRNSTDEEKAKLKASLTHWTPERTKAEPLLWSRAKGAITQYGDRCVRVTHWSGTSPTVTRIFQNLTAQAA